MATTTTNFGWDIPQSTDLVKDGATAIAALGQDIDTALVDLKGGTTGQVLAKASATDLDYSWVTTDDTNAIQNAIVDAKGDLIAASANDTPARLAVGNNGETLVADSSTSTGLRYQVGNGLAQGLINGGFDVWQRSTSSNSSGGYYSADRWAQYNLAGSGTFARTTSNIATGQVYGLSWTSNGAGSQGNIYQAIETLNAVSFAGKTVTVSGYLYGTAGKQVQIDFGTSTTDNLAWNGGYSFTTLTTITLTGTVTQYSATVAVGSTVRSLCVAFVSTSTYASTQGWTVSAAQLEVGSVPTQFRRAGGTIQGELAACQRYYFRTSGTDVYKPLSNFSYVNSTTTIATVFSLPVQMRTSPTSIEYAGTIQWLQSGGGAATPSSFTLSTSSTTMVNFNGNSTGLTVSQFGVYRANNDATAYFGFNAEL